ncbi:MAG: 6,7-dimethyl-8-ribityllumazine synthase [Phycisphaerales bacterium JB058]
MKPPSPIAIVVSRYNRSVTSRLFEAARAEIERRGVPADQIAVIDAPGAFELTALSNAAARSRAYKGVVALGCLIHGETLHDRYIADAVAQGITRITIETGIPVAFGLITAETADHASARSGGAKGNKGEEAAAALMDTLTSMDAIARAVAQGRPCEVERLETNLPQDKSENE